MSEPIRVLHVVGTMDFGGVEIMLMNLYRELDREKVQFDFLCHNSKDGAFSEEIAALGGRMFMIPGPSHGGMHKYRKGLYRFFKEHPEYRVIHCHKSDMNGFIVEQANKAGVPYRISHAHTSDPRYGKIMRIFAMWSKGKINPNITHAFACSDNAARYVYGDGEMYRRSRIVLNGIDAMRFCFSERSRHNIRERFGISQDAFVIGHVGKFTPFKNQGFILDVFEDVYNRQPNSYLLYVGAGDTFKEIQQKAAAKPFADRVIFAGMQADIPAFMSAMDCFLFPSIYEGLPVVTIEAQAAGLPVVLSDCLTKEIVLSDLTSYLSLEAACGEWAEHILLQGATKERKPYAEQIAQSGYSSRVIAKELTEFYQSLV